MDTQNIMTILNAALLTASLAALIASLVSAHRLEKRHKDEAERLYQALPPQWQTTILRLIDAADGIVDTAKELTDGQPNCE